MPSILVTGAARGIGRGLALAHLERQWDVTVTVRREDEARAWRDAGAQPLVLDVTQASAFDTVGAGLTRPLDVLVNNAGVLGPDRQSSLDMDFDGFLETLATNTIGPLRVAQAALPRLEQSSRPRIVNVSSRMGSLSYAKSDTLAYRASKAALNKVTQALATDLAGRVTVVAVHPGWVRTDLGGAYGDLSVEESVDQLVALVDRLGPRDSGRFLDLSGQALPW